MSETRRILRKIVGAILDELRQRRATDQEILRRLDVLIRQTGGALAKVESTAEDVGQLQEQVQQHEREIARIRRPA